MPLLDRELIDVKRRILNMVMDTIQTIRVIHENAEVLFGENSNQVRAAINEYLQDFIDNPSQSGQKHPEALIYQTLKEKFQEAGLYGSQLALKERQVNEANSKVRASLAEGQLSIFRSPFKQWIDRINSFLGSVASATGLSEALKELKDCLRDELPDDD
jgi:hypothetical protein